MSRRFSTKTGPSQRQLRAGEVIRHALAEIFHREEMRDPALAGIGVTVTQVRPSPDLRHASVYCTILGGALLPSQKIMVAIKALNSDAPFLRGLLGRRIDLKFTPALHFVPDESFDEARRIEELLALPQVQRDTH